MLKVVLSCVVQYLTQWALSMIKAFHTWSIQS